MSAFGRYSAGIMPALCRHFVGSMPAACWHFSCILLALCWHFAGIALFRVTNSESWALAQQLPDTTKAAARLCVLAIPCVTLLREALVYFLTAKAAFFSIFHALSEKSVENAWKPQKTWETFAPKFGNFEKKWKFLMYFGILVHFGILVFY